MNFIFTVKTNEMEKDDRVKFTKDGRDETGTVERVNKYLCVVYTDNGHIHWFDEIEVNTCNVTVIKNETR